MQVMQITEDEYIEACRVATKASFRPLRFIAVVAPATLIFPLALYAAGHPLPPIVVVMAVVGACIGGYIGRVAFIPSRARKIYRQNIALHSPVEYSWSEAGLHIRAATGSNTVPWSHYRKMAESPAVCVLFLTDVLFHIIPASAFSDTVERDAFRAMVQSRLGANKP